MPSSESVLKKRNQPLHSTHSSNSNNGSENTRALENYIEELELELQEERDEKEALSLERAKLKVCWEMTLEELAITRTELSDKILNLENELKKQMKKKKVLHNLLKEYGNNLDEMKGVIENIIIDRPKCNIKY